jgi:hypothetical protein
MIALWNPDAHGQQSARVPYPRLSVIPAADEPRWLQSRVPAPRLLYDLSALPLISVACVARLLLDHDRPIVTLAITYLTPTSERRAGRELAHFLGHFRTSWREPTAERTPSPARVVPQAVSAHPEPPHANQAGIHNGRR